MQEQPAGGPQYDLLSLFADGGEMMYALVLLSLVGLGVIIAKAWTLWVAHRDTEQVLEEVKGLALEGRIEEAMEVASSTPGPTAAILLAGLRRIEDHQSTQTELEQAVNTTGTIELGFLERGLPILATIANVAPLMGFLGTVIGMIMAFQAIEIAGDVDPVLVAGGIKVALLTTATGLAIAVPVNIAYNFFVSRVDTLIVDMEQGTQAVLNVAWDLEKEGIVDLSKPTPPPGRGAGVGTGGPGTSPGTPGPAPGTTS